MDLGIAAPATLSTGETFSGPKALRTLLARLRQLSRAVSRKVKGSRNRARAKLKLARLHARIANIRRDSLHKLSTRITRRFHMIGIEDLNVKGMLGNRHLARAIADMGFHELRRQLGYKAAWRGGQVVLVDRWYPSSKLCSCCGHRLEELALGTRSWTCPGCGVRHDRDVNAAVNLKNMAMSSIATACGDDRLVECHGSIHHLQCTRPCSGAIWPADTVDPVIDRATCLMAPPLPRCPHCGALARPNILMFGDGRWLDARTEDQYARFGRWRAQVRKPVVIELGAGTDVPSVRHMCEAQGAPLIRINPREPHVGPRQGVGIALGALEALASLRTLLG